MHIWFGGILLAGFFAASYISPALLNTVASIRTQLPDIHAQSGTLALVTEPDDGIAPVFELIQSAKSSIDLVIYQLKDKAIGDALIEAQKRGVRVRVLLNAGYYGKQEKVNMPAYEYLKSHSIEVHFTPSYFALTHQKTIIIDREKAFIMTFNLVPKYYPTGREFGIITTNPNDVKSVADTFDADWNSKKISTQYGDSLVWSPNSETDMLLIIKNAKKTLSVYNEEMAYDVITDALIDAAKRGVDVKIVMTYAANWRSAFATLRNNGVHIRTYEGAKSLYIHAKMIVADDAYAFVGSENFSENSLNKNRELGLFISDPVILKSLIHTFTNDWNKGEDF